MKKTIIIFAMLISTCGNAQKICADSTLSFIRQNMGKKVGDGVCFSLVRKAMEKQNPQWIKKSIHEKRYRVRRPKPGDVIVFEMALFSGEPLIYGHTGIVYQVLDNGVIIYADQNSGMAGDKKIGHAFANSHVQLSKSDMDALESGKVFFYRY